MNVVTPRRSETAPPPHRFTYPAVPGGDIPAIFVVTVAAGTCLSLVAGWVGWDFLAGRASATAMVATALVLAIAAVRALRTNPAPVSRGAALALGVPCAGVVAVAVVGVLRGAPAGLEWFLNGDHPRHAVQVALTWAQGNLSYAVEAYPRGWQSVIASLWAGSSASLDPPGVLRLLAIMAPLSMALSATLALAMSHLGHALALRLRIRGDAAVVVGVAAGSLCLLNVFLANYQALGYQNSLVAAVALAVCGREALTRPGTALSVVVCGAGVVVVAHSWQLLLPAVGVAALWCAVGEVRRTTRWVTIVLASVFVTLVMSAPPMLAATRDIGVSHAGAPGPDSPVPMGLLIAGLACATAVAIAHREAAVISVALVTALPALIGATLAFRLGVELSSYYPSKLLWHSAMLGLPWVVTAVALGVLRIVRQRSGLAPVARVLTGTALGLLVASTLILPWGSQVGAWSTVEGERVLAGLVTPQAPRAAVVWLEASPTTDAVTRSLLDVFRVREGVERAPQDPLTVGEECALLRAADDPVVLSTAREDQARERYSCVEDLVVLRVDLPD